MNSKDFITENASIVDSQRQQVIDPYDAEHTAQRTKNHSIAISEFSKFQEDNNITAFSGDTSWPARSVINQIDLNSRTDDSVYVHVLEFNITGRGKNNRDPRNKIFYVVYSNDKFEDSFGTKNQNIKSVDQLPIYWHPDVRNVKPRYRWRYLADDHRNTKGQDRIKPSDFARFQKSSILDDPSVTGARGLQRLADLDIDTDKLTSDQKQQLQAARTEAASAQTQAVLAALSDNKQVTANNIVRIIKKSRGSTAQDIYRPQKTSEYLADLMSTFVSQPNNAAAIYPLQLTDAMGGEQLMQQIGVQGVNSIAVDFMEVVHPAALLAGNCTGNARKMAESFFEATQQELMDKAVISYTRAGNFPLIDSAIFYRSSNSRGYKRLGVSSKQSGSGEGAQGSGFPSLQVAWREAQDMAKEQWNEQVQPLLNQNPKYKLAWQAIRYKMADEELPTQLIDQMAKAFGSQETDPLKIFLTVAESPEFQQLIVWIFNHSATVQIDTRADYGNADRGQPAVISNIVATWPTQLATSVEVSSDGKKIKLLVNGRENNFTPELGDRTDVEYSKLTGDEGKSQPRDWSDEQGMTMLKTLARTPGLEHPQGRDAGTAQVNYGRPTNINPATFTTVPLSSIPRINRESAAARYLMIRMARLIATGFKYLPYSTLRRWTQTNTIAEARSRASDTAQAQQTVDRMNSEYRDLLAKYGTALDKDAASKFPLSGDIVKKLEAFASNSPYAAVRGKIDYNPQFMEVLEAISSASSGNQQLQQSIADFVKIAQNNLRTLNAFEIEASNLASGTAVPASATQALTSFYPATVKSLPKKTDPQEQRIQNIIAIARRDNRAKDPEVARQEILQYGLDNSDEDLASVVSESKHHSSKDRGALQEMRRIIYLARKI